MPLSITLDPNYKTCKKEIGGCGESKTLSEFYFSPSSKDGHYSVCRTCFSKKSNKNYVSRKKYSTKTKIGALKA